jgi:hypothetical protein
MRFAYPGRSTRCVLVCLARHERARRFETDNTRWLARKPFNSVSAAPGSRTGRVNTQ